MLGVGGCVHHRVHSRVRVALALLQRAARRATPDRWFLQLFLETYEPSRFGRDRAVLD